MLVCRKLVSAIMVMVLAVGLYPASAFAAAPLAAGEGDYPLCERGASSLSSQAQQAMPDWKGSLFAKKSSAYSNALALKAAEMSENAYGGDGNSENINIKRMIGYYGFDDFKSYNYAKNYSPSGVLTKGSNNSAFTVGHDKLKIGGKTYMVLVVVARGTTSKAETVGDLNLFDITRKINGYEVRKNDYDFYSEISKGVEDYVKNHSAVAKAAKEGELKVLVTGHSLGGAAANLYAAHLNKEASKSGSSWKRQLEKDAIYAYTFGAIKVFMDNANVEFGYENIHNVYNYYDSFGPHGSKEWLHVSDPKAKFGHTDMFNIGKIEEGSNLLDAVHNHDMSRYIEALKAKGVSCSGKQTYKVVFKSNKGLGAMLPQIITRDKKTALHAVTYQRAGYKFVGWNTKANGKGKAYKDKAKVKSLAKAGKSVTLYAQWKKASSALSLKQAKKAYSATLKKLKASSHDVSCKYADIVGDKTIEMIVITNPNYGGSAKNYVYTIASGKPRCLICEQRQRGWFNVAAYKKSKSLVVYGMDNGSDSWEYYKLKGGKYKRVASKSCTWEMYGSEWSYYASTWAKRISKASFNKKVRGLTIGSRVIVRQLWPYTATEEQWQSLESRIDND